MFVRDTSPAREVSVLPVRNMIMQALEKERKYLDSHKDELLKQYGGKILVISGNEVTGAFDTMEEALQGAVEKHGLTNVLIRRPSEAQIEFSAPALTLGILRADTTQSNDGPGKGSRR
jgi:hypothetical protein